MRRKRSKKSKLQLSATLGLLGLSVVLQALCSLYPPLVHMLAFSLDKGLLSVLTIFTYMVSHANWGHLIGNFAFGLPFMLYLEKKLGRGPFLQFYAITGMASLALHLLMMGPQFGIIGSSGSIFGVAMGACMLFGRNTVEHLVGLCMALALLLPQIALAPLLMMEGVAVYGHIGGALCGMMLCIKLFSLRPKRAS